LMASWSIDAARSGQALHLALGRRRLLVAIRFGVIHALPKPRVQQIVADDPALRPIWAVTRFAGKRSTRIATR
jgi:hypothetical protein